MEDKNERPIHILLVEDNPGDVRLIREAFNEAMIKNDVNAVSRGRDALDHLYQRDEYKDTPVPDIVLLDLRLPGMSGLEVLGEIKNSDELKSIPVIILTNSEIDEDIAKGYQEHANAYLTKPVDPDEFISLAKSIGEFWIQMVKLPNGNTTD